MAAWESHHPLTGPFHFLRAKSPPKSPSASMRVEDVFVCLECFEFADEDAVGKLPLPDSLKADADEVADVVVETIPIARFQRTPSPHLP